MMRTGTVIYHSRTYHGKNKMLQQVQHMLSDIYGGGVYRCHYTAHP